MAHHLRGTAPIRGGLSQVEFQRNRHATVSHARTRLKSPNGKWATNKMRQTFSTWNKKLNVSMKVNRLYMRIMPTCIVGLMQLL